MMNRSLPSLVCLIALEAAFVTVVLSQDCTYTTTCYNQEHYTVKCGWWSRCGRYRSVAVSCTKTASCTNTLLSCGLCSQSCDGGSQSCTYQCRGSYCSLPSTVRNQTCNTHKCPPVDGGWTDWSDWTYDACSVTCGEGMQVRSHSRSCTNPEPKHGGKPCEGNPAESETIPCKTDDCPPIDGGWTDWSDWTYDACSVTCGQGVQIRTHSRSCTNPEPKHGGKPCEGNPTESETIPCKTDDCPPIDGGWTDWSDWTYDACSVTCGQGVQIRIHSRSCTNPEPKHGGKPCEGNPTESETIPCKTDDCPPIDGGWTDWGDWTHDGCSVTCGQGVQVRIHSRSCTNPEPKHGGKPCEGNPTESETIPCKAEDCPPIPGGWTEWGDWSYDACSVTCGGGLRVRNRSRSCTNPEPQYRGEPCEGNTTESETIPCKRDKCPTKVHGGWSSWGKWVDSNCSRTCGGGIRVRYQTRSCTKPAPMNGGNQCVGLTYKHQVYVCNTKICPKPKIREYPDLRSFLDAMFSDQSTCKEGKQRVNIGHCERFQVCINNTWQELECINGTVYNSYTEACNWPDNVPGCNTTSNIISMDTETRGGDGSECSSEECTCREGIDVITRHPTDCRKFIICARNTMFVESCADNTYWNQSILSCQSGTC